MTMIGIDNSFLLTVCLTVVILVVSRECTGSSHPGVSVHLSHRDRKMNMQYFNDLRRDIGAADMNEIVRNAFFLLFITSFCFSNWKQSIYAT